MPKPTTLYYYEHHRLFRHRITGDCELELQAREPRGDRYRCRCSEGYNKHDVYGYGTLKAAKDYEIREAKLRIFDEKKWLEKLTKEPVEEDTLKLEPVIVAEEKL